MPQLVLCFEALDGLSATGTVIDAHRLHVDESAQPDLVSRHHEITLKASEGGIIDESHAFPVHEKLTSRPLLLGTGHRGVQAQSLHLA